MKKSTKPSIIRARCGEELKRSIEQVAQFQQLDVADIIRIACARYVQKVKQPGIFNG